jgi:hypothetical protein
LTIVVKALSPLRLLHDDSKGRAAIPTQTSLTRRSIAHQVAQGVGALSEMIAAEPPVLTTKISPFAESYAAP